MIRALKSEIDEYVSYSKVIAPKGRLEDIKKYLASNYYKKREVPDAVTEKILLVSAVQDKVSDLQRKLLRLEQGINAEYDYDIVRLADFVVNNSGISIVNGGKTKKIALSKNIEWIYDKVTDSQRNEIALYGSNMLAAVENNYVMSEMATVSRRTGVYGVSRAVNPLQRLFTGHVLRDFDLRLIEVEDDSATHRALSMRGRVYMDRDFNEYLVIRDDLGEFLTLIDCQGSESVTTIQKVRSSMTGKSYERARWNTFSIEATVAEYGENLPESWREAIQQMSPRVLENKK